ncbi:unnamed protein product [Clavelina lepadiformis]|uniref:Uncharacterized protein n=1 Tax=Clavelina lepadiformis TaxID=159417 RepID=A0ABP0GV39_CLALP
MPKVDMEEAYTYKRRRNVSQFKPMRFPTDSGLTEWHCMYFLVLSLVLMIAGFCIHMSMHYYQIHSYLFPPKASFDP